MYQPVAMSNAKTRSFVWDFWVIIFRRPPDGERSQHCEGRAGIRVVPNVADTTPARFFLFSGALPEMQASDQPILI